MKKLLRALPIVALVATALAVPALVAKAPQIITVTPTADTFVTAVQPTSNFSTSTSMRVNGTPQKISLLQFDVTNIPATARNVSAKLVLRGADAMQTAQTVTVSSVGTFTPSTVTYNSRPTVGATIGTVAVARNSTGQLTLPGLTNGVQRYAVTTSGTADSVLSTVDATDAFRRPRIEITYESTFDLPVYGSVGSGDPNTSDCTATVASGGDIAAAITAAVAGDVVCVLPQDQSNTTVTVNKAITVRTTGVVKIQNAIITAGATIDGFTVVGGVAGNPSAGILFSGSNNRITNNLINGHALERGVQCTSCSSGTVISHNTITEINGYGIQTGGSSQSTVIEWNNIYDLYDTADNGLDIDGMRPFGTNNIVRNNYMHDMNSQRSILGSDNDLPHLDCIQHYQSGGLSAINLLIENNYCVRVTGNFIISKNNLTTDTNMRDMTIRGNVAEAYGNQVIILSGVPNVVVENNTLFGGSSGGSVITVENGDNGAPMTNARLQNNILVRGVTQNASIGDKSGNAYDAGIVTLVQKNPSWVDTTIADRDAIWATDPSIAENASPINPDDFTAYRIWEQRGGYALANQGATLLSSGYTNDAAGNARVQGSAVDIGAYELG